MPIIPFAAIVDRRGRAGLAAVASAHGRRRSRSRRPPPRQPRTRTSRSPRPWPSTRSRSSWATACCRLINDLEGRRLTDQIKALRRTLAGRLRLRHAAGAHPRQHAPAHPGLPPSASRRWRPAPARCASAQLMAMDPRGGQVELPGEHVREPAFGLPATWIDDGLREEATFRGYTIVDPATVLTTHLTEILKENMPDLLSYAEVQKLLKDLPAEQKKLVDDLIPVGGHRHHRAARAAGPAARAGVDPRPAGHPGRHRRGRAAHRRRSPCWSSRSARRLAAQLCWANRGDDGALPIVTLSAEWEQRLRRRPGRPGRREAAGPGPVAPAGVHPRRARRLRAGGPGRRARRCC